MCLNKSLQDVPKQPSGLAKAAASLAGSAIGITPFGRPPMNTSTSTMNSFAQ